jgi:hypothetical protein
LFDAHFHHFSKDNQQTFENYFVNMAQVPDETFNALLTSFGFNDTTVAIMNEEGLISLQTLAQLSLDDMDNFTKAVRALQAHQQPAAAAVPVAGGGDGAAVEVPQPPAPVRFPFLALRKLRALRVWLQDRAACGQGFDVASFTQATLEKYIRRLDERASFDLDKKPDDKPDGVVPEFKDMTKWPTFEERLLTFFATEMRNKNTGAPLSYVVRENKDVTPEALEATYESVDAQLIATLSLTGDDFCIDNRRVYLVLKGLVIDGPGWAFIRKFNKDQDGRGAYFALKAQAEGQSAITTRLNKAYAMIQNASYNGRSKNFTFDKYIEIHQKAHNELLALGESISETKKVRDFLQHISDPKLATAKTVVAGDPAKLENFELCQQYLKTCLHNSGADAPQSNVTIGSVSTVQEQQRLIAQLKRENAALKNGGNKGKGSGGKKPQPNGGGGLQSASGHPLHGGYYAPKVYRTFTDEEKQVVRKLREEKKKRKVADVNSQQERNAGAVASVVQFTDDQETSNDVQKEEEPASAQFGRDAHANKKPKNKE